MTPGSASWGCYGSPIQTPNFDALAADGLRYNNMHTTALCSPSRSCILTGRNHHSNADGLPSPSWRERLSRGTGRASLPFENGFLSEMLLEHWYSTLMVGQPRILTPSNPGDRGGPV